MSEPKSLIATDKIEDRILLIRGVRVMMDADLAEYYGVPTKRLNEQVKRNLERFPSDFMFQLSASEKTEVVAICDHLSGLRFSPSLPYAFTEHGAIMAASVLNSPRAVEMSVFIVRAFVHLRRAIGEHKELAKKIAQLEGHLSRHDHEILALVQSIRHLATSKPIPPRRRIGFAAEED
jgi:hypothetical protein